MEVKENSLVAKNASTCDRTPSFGRGKYNMSKEFIYMEGQGHLPDGQMPKTETYNKTNQLNPASWLDIIPSSSSSSPQQDKQIDSTITIGNYIQKLNTELLEAVESKNIEEIVRLLKEGASPNATCRMSHVSACHIAALNGGEVLPLLLKAGVKIDRFDKLGRTPLHFAAWAGNAKEIAVLLHFPEDLSTRVCDENMPSETDEEVKQLIPTKNKAINVVCDTGVINILPKTWMDGIGHDCRGFNEHIPILKPNWTPLHAASYCARAHCVRLLLAAGADPDIRDFKGRIPLDVGGCAVYGGHIIDSMEFTKTIKLLIKVVGKNNELHFQGYKINGPLHAAIELSSLEAIKILLDAGVSALHLNRDGLTPMHICVKKELKEHLQLLVNHDYSKQVSAVNCKDKGGFTVLHAAVRSGWMPGVCISLEAGADITLTANNGETALHEAAAQGNLDVLNELLNDDKRRGVVDVLNDKKETALLTAVREGHLECVHKLLKEGASIKHKLPGNINVLHIASDKGHLDILSYLIDSNFAVTHEMINSPNDNRRYGDTPLQCAVINNHLECVEFLLSKNADVRYDSKKGFLSSPLHIAVMNNNSKIANIILDFDKTTLNLVNCLGWTPLHTACRYASRECIRLLLQRGADMSKPQAFLTNETAFSMIMNNLIKPTEFMEDIFDSCIKYRTEPIEKASVIDIDYSILAPNDGDKKQMKVINILRSTGNRYNQKKLLLHPLVKSFLYLKWKALLPFFYTILILYSSYVISLTMLIMSVFTYKYNKEDAPAWLNTTFWSYVLFPSMFFVVILEIIYSKNIKSKTYFLHLEFWARLSSVILGIILAPALVVVQSDAEWLRHLSTVAVLASWLELMFLSSRFPKWGYYFLMFGTVASKMLKVLSTFIFLLIGFSLGFMIQFHSESPFDNFWSAIVKTMVMMISEFNYDGIFKDTYSKELAKIMLQIIFLVFIIVTAVVLMNLMVGVAVNDVQNLELIGNIKRIVKQIDLLGSLESLVYSNIFNKILPKYLNRSLQNRREIRKHITLQLGNSFNENILPYHIIDAIFDQAFAIKKRMEDQVDSEEFKTQVNEIHKTIVLKTGSHEMPCNGMLDLTEDKINNKKIFKENRKQRTPDVEDNITNINELSTKIEQMNIKISAIEQSLLRIENIFSKCKKK